MDKLKSYSEKLVEIQLLKNNNAQIFADLENLEQEKDELEAQLKKEVKENGVDVENDIVKITVSERYSKFYNFVKFSLTASEEEVKALNEANGVIQEIDKDIFENLHKQGVISDNTKQISFEEKLLNTAITIKSKI